jgi:integrase
MAISSTIKRGRKPIPYVTSWGDPIPGLARRPSDGRWRVVATGFTFTEPTERLAVDRFYELTGHKEKTTVNIPTSHTDLDEAAAAFVHRRFEGNEDRTFMQIDEDDDAPVVVANWQPSAAVWNWFREQILTRPQYVAQMTGIEQIGWLTDVKRPTISPELDMIGEMYAKKPGLSDNEASRSRLFWKEFTKAIGVGRVRDITHEHVAAYEKVITESGLAAKSILHRVSKVRTIFAYAIKRGVGIEDCRKVLDITAMLEVKEHTPLDPKPIEVDQFWALHKAATDAGDKVFSTLMLFALNCGMYSSEVAKIKWEEVDLKRGEVVTRRSKTGVSRVAVLWPDVVKALKELDRPGEYVFNTRVRSYTTFSVLEAWRKYRTAADVNDEITFGQIRDAAFTVACRVSLDQARVLAGHRLPGASDHYIRRAPQFVAGACEAIRAEFYAKPEGQKEIAGPIRRRKAAAR